MITFEILRNTPWEDVIQSCHARSKDAYREAFLTASRNPAFESHQESLKLLYEILSFSLKLDESGKKYSYCPFWATREKRTFLPCDLSMADANALFEFIQKVDDIILKAIISDTLWGSPGTEKQKYAETAIENYLLFPSLDGMPSYEICLYLGRAVDLALKCGKKETDMFKKCIEVIVRYVSESPTEKMTYNELRLLRMLSHCLDGDQSEIIKKKCILASEWHEEAKSNMPLVASFFNHALFLESQKNPPNSKQIKQLQYRIAESYYIDSESRQDSAIVRSQLLKQAIQAHRKYGNKERAEELHRMLLTVQPKITDELSPIHSESIDIADAIQESEELVRGKSIVNALFSLALIDSPISIDELIPIAKSALENNEMIQIFGAPLYVGMDGKSSRIPGSILDDDISPELDFFLTELIKAHLSLSVEAEILPAVQIIQKEHQIDISALEYFVHNNSFIPEDHEYYYARGLCAGFAFDFPLFCVLVIPQLENSFRHILLNNEGNPSCLDATGNQAEKNFDCVTKEQIILDKFGKPFIDLLRRLLTDPRFSKIRHSIAHGLLPYSSLNSDYAVYLWWLTLRLVLLPHLPKQ